MKLLHSAMDLRPQGCIKTKNRQGLRPLSGPLHPTPWGQASPSSEMSHCFLSLAKTLTHDQQHTLHNTFKSLITCTLRHHVKNKAHQRLISRPAARLRYLVNKRTHNNPKLIPSAGWSQTTWCKSLLFFIWYTRKTIYWINCYKESNMCTTQYTHTQQTYNTNMWLQKYPQHIWLADRPDSFVKESP